MRPLHHALVRRLVFDTLTVAQARQLGTVSQRISTAIGPDEAWRPPAREHS